MANVSMLPLLRRWRDVGVKSVDCVRFEVLDGRRRKDCERRGFEVLVGGGRVGRASTRDRWTVKPGPRPCYLREMH